MDSFCCLSVLLWFIAWFAVRGLRLYFPAGALGHVVCLAPQLFLPVYPHVDVEPRVLQLPPCCESSLPGCPAPPLLPVWVSVSSWTPWLSDFHTVRFSGSSGFFFVFKFVVVLFWLCEEAKLFTYTSILSMSPMYGLSHVLKAFYSFSLRRS